MIVVILWLKVAANELTFYVGELQIFCLDCLIVEDKISVRCHDECEGLIFYLIKLELVDIRAKSIIDIVNFTQQRFSGLLWPLFTYFTIDVLITADCFDGLVRIGFRIVTLIVEIEYCVVVIIQVFDELACLVCCVQTFDKVDGNELISFYRVMRRISFLIVVQCELLVIKLWLVDESQHLDGDESQHDDLANH